MLKQRPYLAVFSDISMPVMDGFALIKAFRAWEAAPASGRGGTRQFVAAMSANTSIQEAAQAKELGMDYFLDKPVTKQSMLDLLRRLAAGASGAGGAVDSLRPAAAATGASPAPQEQG